MVLKAKNGQEWTHPDPSHHSRSICTPQKHWHADYLWFFEFWLLRQAKAKNSDKNLILQTFGKLFFYLHSGFLSQNQCLRSGCEPNHLIHSWICTYFSDILNTFWQYVKLGFKQRQALTILRKIFSFNNFHSRTY